MAIYFGVRHLSPAGAKHLIRMLDEVKPDLVLVEGPSDLTELLESVCLAKTKPPIAIMAYSETVPIHTILYPFAEYSPEYQAILWAHRKKKVCRFIDLPASVFLALSANRSKAAAEKLEEAPAEMIPKGVSVYQQIEAIVGEEQETNWERTFEHCTSHHSYHTAVNEYGRQLRELTLRSDEDYAENLVREGYMKYQVECAIKEGFKDNKILVVTGAFHVAGLETCAALTEKEIAKLPKLPCKSTLMPYSYYRLSQRSGYGAGNKAPAYYELLWGGHLKEDLAKTAYDYLAQIAVYQRKHGGITSSAEVIEAMRLSSTLAGLRGHTIPSLQDLRDSAMTCMGHGVFSEISLAVADTEIGTKIGSLPEGVSRTSIQQDFYYILKDLKLEKYKTLVAENLELDLRENTRVKSEKSAFLDLERSFFLHRLVVLGVGFGEKLRRNQDSSTWGELWSVRWTPEAEIEIIEAALKGDTIELACAFCFAERLEQAKTITETALIISETSLCGMPKMLEKATATLQGLAVDAASVLEIAETAYNLSSVVRFGSIRRLDLAPLIPILQQLFLRACLILVGSCICDNNAVAEVIKSIGTLNDICLNHDFLDDAYWLSVLTEISHRDDINTKASGYATAILLERGKLSDDLLATEVQRRLSKGIPADLGAGWFEGLALKNRYALIARLSLWQKLSEYIEELDDEEFKRALFFLRRGFSDFSSREKSDIAENLGEIWGVNTQQVSEVLNSEVTAEQKKLLSELDDFDFGDLI